MIPVIPVLRRIGYLATGFLALVLLVFSGIFFAVRLGITNAPSTTDPRIDYFNKRERLKEVSGFTWAKGEEWDTFKAGIIKDEQIIKRVAGLTNISPRLLVAIVVPEQLRLYHSLREVFKTFFSPLKILGTQNQFSLGIVGLKPDTALKIETYLTDRLSPYYLGPQYEQLLAFQTNDQNRERFTRLTDENNHYWSYLYEALYLKEIKVAWQKAGYDISNKPEILATLYNIGFANSQPKPNPRVGGSIIHINNQTYSFGSLAYEFYYSDELIDIFPAY